MGLNKTVEYPLAKLLKENGYENEECENIYLGDFDEDYPPEKMEVSTRRLSERGIGEFDCIAPTIAETVMWLYEKHGIWIYLIPAEDNKDVFKPFFRGKNIIDQHLTEFFNSPSEAYEAAIEYTLKNLI